MAMTPRFFTQEAPIRFEGQESRIFFAMSRDGLIPPVFSRIHPTFRTPYISQALIGVVVAVLAALTPIDVVAELVNIGTLGAFILVSIGVILLRRREPGLARGFRVPGLPWLPILSIAGCLVLIAKLPPLTIGRFIVWLAIGFVVYFLYSRKRSKLADQQKP